MSAIQQREDTLRSRLLAYFDREMVRIPMSNPTLSDLIQLLIESPRVHVARSHASLPAEQSYDRFDYGHSSSQREASRRSHQFDTAPGRDRLGEPRQLREYHVNMSHEGSMHRRSTSPKQQSIDDSVRGSTRDSAHGLLHQSRASSSQPRSASNARGHHSGLADHDIISSMAEREARALSSRAPQSYDHFETGRSYEKEPPPVDSRALSSSQGPSAAAQALQDRIRKAQQTFRAMRDSSNNQ